MAGPKHEGYSAWREKKKNGRNKKMGRRGHNRTTVSKGVDISHGGVTLQYRFLKC